MIVYVTIVKEGGLFFLDDTLDNGDSCEFFRHPNDALEGAGMRADFYRELGFTVKSVKPFDIPVE